MVRATGTGTGTGPGAGTLLDTAPSFATHAHTRRVQCDQARRIAQSKLASSGKGKFWEIASLVSYDISGIHLGTLSDHYIS